MRLEDEIAQLHREIDEKNAMLFQMKKSSVLKESIFSNNYVPTILRQESSQGLEAKKGKQNQIRNSKVATSKPYCLLI